LKILEENTNLFRKKCFPKLIINLGIIYLIVVFHIAAYFLLRLMKCFHFIMRIEVIKIQFDLNSN
jgi:hypothetical protein